jgi:hypothetical protein
MATSLSMVTRGVAPVWGDTVVVLGTEINQVGVAAGLTDTDVLVGDEWFSASSIDSVEVVGPISVKQIVELLGMAGVGEVDITGHWTPESGRQSWGARWGSVESIQGSMLHGAVVFGNTPEEALRGLWWLATTQRMVFDAYDTKSGRREFRWNGPATAWADQESV